MIRNFKIDDSNSVMQIWLETNIKTHSFIEKSYWQENYAMVKEALPNSTIFVYEDNGIIQGFVGLTKDYIAGIFINEKSQSKGIGKALLNYLKDKYSKLSLRVYKKNIRAIKFYLRENFTISKEEIDKNTNEMEIVMIWKKSV